MVEPVHHLSDEIVDAVSFLDGEFIDDGVTILRENPARPDRIVSRVAASSPALVHRAVEAADAAAPEWAATAVAERARTLRRIAVSFGEIAEDLARLQAREMGKPITDCRLELLSAELIAESAADHAEQTLAVTTRETQAGGILRTEHRPFGVMAGIVPWNAPINLSITKIALALAAGNTIVVKPSPFAAASTTKFLTHIARQLPGGVLNIVQGDVEAGGALVTDPLVRRVSFTGGSRAAEAILAAVAPRLVQTTLELGGNDAALVLEDAVLDDAAMRRAVTASYRTAGQVCMAAKRWYVHASRYEEFVGRWEETANRIVRVGDPAEETTTVGPVVSAAAARRVRGLVDDAAGRGAEVRTVGTVDDIVSVGGYFLQPTIVLGAVDEWPVVAEEQFGPTVPILRVDGVDEAVRRANDSPYGLASSVWSADAARAFEVAQRLEAGYTFINTHSVDGLSFDAPFGGVKRSGFGREYGPEGILEYSASHTTHYPAHVRVA
jgi:acyl-CoA reductase-like NAD-dependent aldehyde dehydrogenase